MDSRTDLLLSQMKLEKGRCKEGRMELFLSPWVLHYFTCLHILLSMYLSLNTILGPVSLTRKEQNEKMTKSRDWCLSGKSFVREEGSIPFFGFDTFPLFSLSLSSVVNQTRLSFLCLYLWSPVSSSNDASITLFTPGDSPLIWFLITLLQAILGREERKMWEELLPSSLRCRNSSRLVFSFSVSLHEIKSDFDSPAETTDWSRKVSGVASRMRWWSR